MNLTVHYRGPLSSCNYTCDYCPFAKEWEAPDVLAADRAGVERFVAWASATSHSLRVLFTPWGEALVRPWYRDAMRVLGHRITEVAAQTNLSMNLDWLAEAGPGVALWCTWHPGQVRLERFLAQVDRLRQLGIRHSVGVVGLKEHFGAIEALAARIPSDTTLWVNAYKRAPHYYSADERAWLRSIDPRFDDNRAYSSKGEPCWAGETHFTVDGMGDVRRCHFVDEPVLGNLYRDSLTALLRPRACPNTECRCHIGYVHLKSTGLRAVYGDGLMARTLPAGDGRV